MAAVTGSSISLSFFHFKLLKNLFILESERDSAQARGGGGGRERETQNPKQAPGSEPSAQSPVQGLISRNVKSQPELKSDA